MDGSKNAKGFADALIESLSKVTDKLGGKVAGLEGAFFAVISVAAALIAGIMFSDFFRNNQLLAVGIVIGATTGAGFTAYKLAPLFRKWEGDVKWSLGGLRDEFQKIESLRADLKKQIHDFQQCQSAKDTCSNCKNLLLQTVSDINSSYDRVQDLERDKELLSIQIEVYRTAIETGYARAKSPAEAYKEKWENAVFAKKALTKYMILTVRISKNETGSHDMRVLDVAVSHSNLDNYKSLSDRSVPAPSNFERLYEALNSYRPFFKDNFRRPQDIENLLKQQQGLQWNASEQSPWDQYLRFSGPSFAGFLCFASEKLDWREEGENQPLRIDTFSLFYFESNEILEALAENKNPEAQRIAKSIYEATVLLKKMGSVMTIEEFQQGERAALTVDVITHDLAFDTGPMKGIVEDNLKRGKRYTYYIKDPSWAKDHIEELFNRWIELERNDGKKIRPEQLNIVFVTKNFPTYSEVGIYDRDAPNRRAFIMLPITHEAQMGEVKSAGQKEYAFIARSEITDRILVEIDRIPSDGKMRPEWLVKWSGPHEE